MLDITYDMPNGPKNLAPLFSGIEFKHLAEYYIELFDQNDDVIVTTPINRVSNDWTSKNLIRLHFLNYCGRYDSVSFTEYMKEDEVKSDTWTKPLPASSAKRDAGLTRSNIKASEKYTAKAFAYSEPSQKWLEQLLESPLVFMEWSGIEGQADDFIPVVILDKNFQNRKENERYIYETVVEFRIANEKIGLRT